MSNTASHPKGVTPPKLQVLESGKNTFGGLILEAVGPEGATWGWGLESLDGIVVYDGSQIEVLDYVESRAAMGAVLVDFCNLEG